MPPTAQLADHTYSHCLAVLGDPGTAADVAQLAIRRGGRSRWAVLAHARHEALSRPHPQPPDAAGATPPDLPELARWLAATRPAEERAIVDLADRHALDRATLGRVWGESPAAAAARIAAVDEAWKRDLDPAVLASLGPGECEELGGLLEQHAVWAPGDPDEPPGVPAPAPAFGHLLAAAPGVAAHAAGCAGCGDRLRAMVSVRTVLGAVPIDEAPIEVRTTARSRRRRPFPQPPPDRNTRLLRSFVTGAVVVGVAALAAGVVIIASVGRDDDRVADLTVIPARGSALAVRPAVIDSTAGSVVLENKSPRVLRWTATTKPFVTVSPASGQLAPGRSTRVHVELTRLAPEGDLRATVTFGSDDGSSTAVRLESAVDHAPDLDARLEGCIVTAAVEDETGIGSVTLHRREGRAESTVAMRETPSGWSAALAGSPADVRWWVSAVDARGNQATTSIEVLPAESCPAP